jgi:hypothetical protein
MERELWPLVYRVVREVGRGIEQKYVHYPPWVIAAVLLWAAIHDRPVGWACDPAHWSTTRLRPAAIPSAATVSRRTRRGGFVVILNAVAARLRGDGPPAWTLIVDGKPLPVGHCTKDRQAKGGPRGPGYKLHTVWGTKPLPDAWAVTPLRQYEGAVAEDLLSRIRGFGYLLGDGNYEASRLYDAADRAGYQLLAPPDPQDNGRGHHYQSPHRRAALALIRDGLGRALLRGRAAIERLFGNATTFAGGLAPLPAWVRTLGRVTRWVWAKLVINAARILVRLKQKEGMQ